LANGSFETAGARPYLAAGWTLTVTAPNAINFARWLCLDTAQLDLGYEDFEWFVAPTLTLAATLAAWTGSVADAENFETLWGATSALLRSARGPYVLASGQTLLIDVDGVGQTVTFVPAQFFDITGATPAEVVAALNTQLTGAGATLVPGGRLVLTSETTGASSTLTITGGTAATALFPGAPSSAGMSASTEHFHKFGAFTQALFDGVDAETFGGTSWVIPANLGVYTADSPSWVAALLGADDFTWDAYDFSTGQSFTLANFAGSTSVGAESFNGTWTALP
jgi:hypothetical protein